MKHLMKTGECEHCQDEIIYESEKFSIEKTKRGKLWHLNNDCTLLEAATEWHSQRDKNNETNEK